MLFAAEDRTSAPLDQVRGRLNAAFALWLATKRKAAGRKVVCGAQGGVKLGKAGEEMGGGKK